jgi:zona occludens toxin (predicted ATPase)
MKVRKWNMIELFTGLPGQGKTYSMVARALKEMDKGRKVYANFPLEGAERFRYMEDVLDVTNGLVLLDEIGLMAPSHFWSKLPYEYLASWRQHRKNGLDIWSTAQDMGDVATAFRKVIQFQHEVERYGKFIYTRTINPRNKTKFGWTLIRQKQKVFDSYDTNFVVEKPKFLTQ